MIKSGHICQETVSLNKDMEFKGIKIEDEAKIPFKISLLLFLFDFIKYIMLYLNMLLTMTYNGWNMLFLVIGLTIGYSLHEIYVEYEKIRPELIEE